MDARPRAQHARARSEFRARRSRSSGRQARAQLPHAAESLARSRGAARSARAARAGAGCPRDGDDALRPCHRSLSHGAAPDLLRRSSGQAATSIASSRRWSIGARKSPSYPIERVEVPFDDGKTISCLLHLLPDRRKAPVVIYVPGMDQTKEVFPKAHHNIGIARGFHVLAMDGPGQGNSNMQKIRAVGDNYERAGAAVIGYLAKRPEVDATQDRDLRHQHGQLLVAAAFELRSPRGRGRKLGRVLQSEQHDLHAVVAALQTDVHVHGGLRRRGPLRRRSREADDGAGLSRTRSNARRCS